ncbi:preprotein translocase subunit SecG [Endozoicomonas sp. GU-1]|uniref:preprotein translocase subunit SecG n=1 Tax=Endozoicomonas sp. GU-1 TaxID=3009078 RepID=UPI0022B3BB0C|nr:preprotein translocase subunit SecG [Endozoicomonas sp. GU-1]WBA82291.1 preprotein translocase subunit SecG [Endozoicomonas sp. GU-1]WBA85227.1 preprotein translocase subunit SecG [Endozoicomonas sp. GU-1]
METIILLVHVLVAVGVIAMIMLQQGKGAETGASFGSGASQTVFGSQGSANFLSRTTAILATIFFVTSIGLAMMARQKADSVADAGLPSVQIEQSVPVNDAPFSVDSLENTIGSDAPVLESQPVESSGSSNSENPQ